MRVAVCPRPRSIKSAASWLLDQASAPEHMDLPGLRLHPLKGELAGFWSVTVHANWRIVFRFENGDVTDVDYLDYH